MLLLADGLRTRGHEQLLIAPTGSALAERARGAGLPVQTAPIRNEGDVRALSRILGRLRRETFDLLHLHTSQAHGLGATAARLVGRRRPGIVVTRRVEHSIFRHSFLRLDRIKYAPGADRVLCVSERVRDVLLADGIAGERLAVVPDGIDVDAVRRPRRDPDAVRAELGVPADVPLLGTVGHLDAGKGQTDLFAALARLQDTPRPWAVLVGDGPARARLAADARRWEVADRVVFAGFRDDVPDLLAAFDVFVFPSLHEGLGSAVLEAMAAGIPVVATRVGGLPEALRHEREGLLVPPGDPEQIADAVAAVLSDPAAAAARVTAARERVEARFSANRMVEATLGEYERVLRRRSRAPSGRSPAAPRE